MVESQPSKLLVAGSIPVSRSRKPTLYKRPARHLLHFCSISFLASYPSTPHFRRDWGILLPHAQETRTGGSPAPSSITGTAAAGAVPRSARTASGRKRSGSPLRPLGRKSGALVDLVACGATRQLSAVLANRFRTSERIIDIVLLVEGCATSAPRPRCAAGCVGSRLGSGCGSGRVGPMWRKLRENLPPAHHYIDNS